jgi:hypothetical protein
LSPGCATQIFSSPRSARAERIEGVALGGTAQLDLETVETPAGDVEEIEFGDVVLGPEGRFVVSVPKLPSSTSSTLPTRDSETPFKTPGAALTNIR